MSLDQDAVAVAPGQETVFAPPVAPAPAVKEAASPAAVETRVAVASQWQLMRWRFLKHKLAVVSLWIIAFLYLVGIVLSLPMHGPLLYRALVSQDMYLAGAFILVIGVLTILGVLLSDVILAWIDPRIRYS